MSLARDVFRMVHVRFTLLVVCCCATQSLFCCPMLTTANRFPSLYLPYCLLVPSRPTDLCVYCTLHFLCLCNS
uniref:Putative secreted protein n=1 Tax=Anopheles darlingi TaxID=43151 RepID=A0A2M4DA11_ANODA